MYFSLSFSYLEVFRAILVTYTIIFISLSPFLQKDYHKSANPCKHHMKKESVLSRLLVYLFITKICINVANTMGVIELNPSKINEMHCPI